MKDKGYRNRILITILYGLVAYSSFALPPAQQSVAVKISPERTISTTPENLTPDHIRAIVQSENELDSEGRSFVSDVCTRSPAYSRPVTELTLKT